jgi:hypothetical protein
MNGNRKRCEWVTDPLNESYHDLEWGVPVHNDVKLFEKLEGARRKRNEIMHKLTTLGDASSIKKKAKESVQENILLQQEIMKRFSGKTPIPSINLYRNGWNDALGHLTETIKSLP